MQNQNIDGELCALRRIDANTNPFYLLATLFGEPDLRDEVTKSRNRRAWNRYYARLLAESERETLIQCGVPAEDVKPYSQEEENKLAAYFEGRQGQEFRFTLPTADAVIDFQNTYFDKNVGFEGYIFSHVVFSGAKFSSAANFKKAFFFKDSHFEGTEFALDAFFDKSVFEGPAQFQAVNFNETASWTCATFNGTAHFDDVKFHGGITFEEARFGLWAAFRNVQFAASDFGSAQFGGGTTFESAMFRGPANFSRARFADWLSFQGTSFHSSSSFSNVEMKNKTIFDDVSFLTQPPEFLSANVAAGTEWDKIKWPKHNQRDTAKKFLIAHERLKREFSKLERRAADMEVLGQKMQSRPILQGRILGLPYAIISFIANSGPSPL